MRYRGHVIHCRFDECAGLLLDKADRNLDGRTWTEKPLGRMLGMHGLLLLFCDSQSFRAEPLQNQSNLIAFQRIHRNIIGSRRELVDAISVPPYLLAHKAGRPAKAGCAR